MISSMMEKLSKIKNSSVTSQRLLIFNASGQEWEWERPIH